jgi:hypothetical protein
LLTSVFQVIGLPKNIAVQYSLLHTKNQTRKMIERQEMNKESTSLGTSSACFLVKNEEDKLVKEFHKKSGKYIFIMILYCFFISIVQNIDLPRSNQTIWSQQVKKRILYVDRTSNSSRQTPIAKES